MESEKPFGNAGRCAKSRSKKRYAKKRRFHGKKKGNQPGPVEVVEEETNGIEQVESGEIARVEDVAVVTTPIIDFDHESTDVNDTYLNFSTASSSKIVDIDTSVVDHSVVTGYRLIDLSILKDVFNIFPCPECHGTNCISLKDVSEKKKGLARFLMLVCMNCLYEHSFCTSKQIENKTKEQQRIKKGGQKLYDINVRAVYGTRQTGIGYEHLKKLCCYLNMPEPMLSRNYSKIIEKLEESAKHVAEESMSNAASSLRGDSEFADVGVSVDGTWQRKGFTSMNGIVTAISIDNGKVLDTSILSKNCKGCTRMLRTKRTDPELYTRWHASHKCGLNFQGSSGAMETAGAKNIFEKSVTKHNLYYTSFYGDGDSKAFPAVQNIYEEAGKEITKFECIGHYQKRVGSRLRKLKKRTKGLGGRGRLTDAKIDTLQNYFGIALRQNCGDLDEMITSCKASMFHVAGYHDNCPKSKSTWCQYQLDKINNTNFFKDKGSFPLDVRAAILPVYTDLCKPENLKKCLHGKTQNSNESFNGMIWNRVPKAHHVGLNLLSFAVYDAISHFNDGAVASVNIFDHMKMNPGGYMLKALGVRNSMRKKRSKYRMSDPQKKRRKMIRHSRKKKEDTNIETEGSTYEAGGF